MIELQYQSYQSSLFQKQKYRFIPISTNHSIDLQSNEEFHLENADLNREVIRELQPRTRSQLSTRFIDPSPFQIQTKKVGQYYSNTDYVWFIKKWFEKNNQKVPTPREIMNGLLEEAKSVFIENTQFSVQKQ